MEPDTMRFRDFESLVALHGTDPALWPKPSLAERADVREWLRRERELDAALSSDLPPLSANFGDRVVSNLPRERSRTPWWIGGAVAATLAAGVFLMQPQPDPQFDPEAEAWETLAEDAGFADLYAWVEGEA